MLQEQAVSQRTLGLLKQVESISESPVTVLQQSQGSLSLVLDDTKVALLPTVKLETMFSRFEKKYPHSEPFMLMKSLAWFEDAETEPDPLFLADQSWPDTQRTVIDALK